jgi:hypothetical protein
MGGKVVARVSQAMMGDILKSKAKTVTLEIDLAAGAPIERVEIRNRMQVLETWRPYTQAELGRRVRIIWEGSEYRGRGRQTVWDGQAKFSGNGIAAFSPINLWNIDKPLKQSAPDTLTWSTLTTGGFGGADVLLQDTNAGTLNVKTPFFDTELPIADIGLDDHVIGTGAGIKRQMRICRLPDHNTVQNATLSRRIELHDDGDNALYVCVTLEDGHMIWSSPTYVLR